MRKIVYYCGGTVTDFWIEAGCYEKLICHLKNEKRNNDKELQRARSVLGAYVHSSAGEAPSLPEQIAACYVWHYFNTHTAANHHIDGNIMIVDLNGHGINIEYVAMAAVHLKPL